MQTRKLWHCLLLVLTVPLLCGRAGQVPAQQTDAQLEVAGNGPPSREEVLRWLDEYLSKELLFKQEDIRAVRDKVAMMTPEELEAWLKKYQSVIAALQSAEWQKTREWLREFLAVQAIYSDEEIEQLRARAAKMSPEELLQLMDRIEQRHKTLIHMRGASEQQREAALQRRERLAAQAARASDARLRAATRPSNRPLFGGAAGHAAASHRDHRSRVPPPLITSREVARRAVWRSLDGYGYFWGW